MSSLLPFFVLTGAVCCLLAVATWFAACRVLAKRQIHCPGHNVDCLVDFEEVRSVPWKTSNRFDVARCELLGWGNRVDCAKACTSQACNR